MLSESDESLISLINKRRHERTGRFNEYKLLSNPFTPYKPETAVKSLADRKEEKEQFADAFLKLTEGEINHIFITGKRGMGKSHLLRYFFSEIESRYAELKIPKPIYFSDPIQCKRWLTENIKNLNSTTYIFLDDAYFIRFFSIFSDEPASNIIFKNYLIKTVSCWQESIIAGASPIEPLGISEDFEEIKLTELKDNDEIELLKKRISISCEKKDENHCLSLFDESFFTELVRISHGNPRLLLRYAEGVFTDSTEAGKKRFNGEDVLKYTAKHGIKTTKQTEETFERLTPPQKRVLYAISAIAINKNKSYCNLTELHRTLSISRPAVLQSLLPLQEMGIVESKDSEHGRAKLYRIVDNYRDFFAERYKDEINMYKYRIDEKTAQEESFE